MRHGYLLILYVLLWIPGSAGRAESLLGRMIKTRARAFHKGWLRQPYVDAVKFGTHSLAVKAFVGSGMNNNVYLVEWRGQSAVAKQLNQTYFINRMQGAITNHREISRMKDLGQSFLCVPEFYGYDPFSRVTLMEYIPGPTLRQRLTYGDQLGRDELSSLQEFYREILALEAQGRYLDLFPENIVQSPTGQWCLVDLERSGQTAPHPLFGGTFAQVYKNWQRHSTSVGSYLSLLAEHIGAYCRLTLAP